MDHTGKTAIVVAVIGLVGALGAAVIAVGPSLISQPPEIATVTCDPIPAVEETPPAPPSGQVRRHVGDKVVVEVRNPDDYIWRPTDFKLSSTGGLERVNGGWQRRAAGGTYSYVPGNWDTSTGRCVWVRGKFIAAGG
jgi:hypothetical protein